MRNYTVYDPCDYPHGTFTLRTIPVSLYSVLDALNISVEVTLRGGLAIALLLGKVDNPLKDVDIACCFADLEAIDAIVSERCMAIYLNKSRVGNDVYTFFIPDGPVYYKCDVLLLPAPPSRIRVHAKTFVGWYMLRTEEIFLTTLSKIAGQSLRQLSDAKTRENARLVLELQRRCTVKTLSELITYPALTTILIDAVRILTPLVPPEELQAFSTMSAQVLEAHLR